VKRSILIVLLFLIQSRISAQVEFTLYHMDRLFQSSYTKPMAKREHKFSIGIPLISSVYAGFSSSAFSLNNIRKPGINGIDSLDLNLLRAHVAKGSNMIYAGGGFDVFHISYQTDKAIYSFNVSQQNSLLLAFPGSIASTPIEGNLNDDFTGKNIDLSGLAMNTFAYNEYAFGYTSDWDKFTYGARVKILQGLYNVSYSADKLDLNTQRNISRIDYDIDGAMQVTADLDATLLSLPNSLGSNTSTGTGLNFTPGDILGLSSSFKNVGAALDLGASYKYDEKWTFSFAANNLGFINWAGSISSEYHFKGTGSFQGFNLGPFIAGGQQLSQINYGDTLTHTTQNIQNGLNGTRVRGNGYATALAPRFYLSARYHIHKNINLDATMTFFIYHKLYPAIGLSGQYNPSRLFSFTATTNLQFGVLHFGAGIIFKPGPVQLYMIADNLAVLDILYLNVTESGTYLPLTSQMMNVRVGMNIAFGYNRNIQRQPLNKGSIKY
jgi:hypothetical protein